MIANKLSQLLAPDVLAWLDLDTQQWLAEIFARFGGDYPTLEQLWALMDEAWVDLNCDPEVMDERISAFYEHRVWLLNGLFVEQHQESIRNRRVFARWVADQKPSRVADYGGGFGSLARMIGELCPNAVVEVIEPHPHPGAIALANETQNVRYCPQLHGQYDVIIATDVFEHVPDPVALVAQTAEFLQDGGHYLIANCFQPVILCHLPQTFHLFWTWEPILARMSLLPEARLLYGTIFRRRGALSPGAARVVERRSQQLYRVTQHLPTRLARPITRLLIR